MKEMSSISPRMEGAAHFDINVEGALPLRIPKCSDSKLIFESLGLGRQFLPPPAAQAAGKKRGNTKYIFQNQVLTSHSYLWHAPCKLIGHRFTANEVPNYSEEGLH